MSNVMLLDPKLNQPTRVGTKVVKDDTTGKKRRMRVARATGEMF
jgi:large subunit ribosomal protein L24